MNQINHDNGMVSFDLERLNDKQTATLFNEVDQDKVGLIVVRIVHEVPHVHVYKKKFARGGIDHQVLTFYPSGKLYGKKY